MKSIVGYLLIFNIFSLLTVSSAVAQDQDEKALAKQSQNPLANLISVPFEFNFFTNAGPDKKTNFVGFVKPVYPLTLNTEWNLINRVIVPVINRDGPGNQLGLGNIQYQGFFSPTNPGKFIWGVGPVIDMPTNTKRQLGTDTLSFGPGVVMLTIYNNWVVGALTTNIWDVAHHNGAPDINLLTFQYFVNYNFSGGWYFVSEPVLTANWEANGGQRWTIPIGGGIGRVIKFDQKKGAVDIGLSVYKNIERPALAPDWQWQLKISFLFPK